MGYYTSCRNTRRSWCRMFPPTSYRTPQDIVFVHAVCKLTSANHAAGTIGGLLTAAAWPPLPTPSSTHLHPRSRSAHCSAPTLPRSSTVTMPSALQSRAIPCICGQLIPPVLAECRKPLNGCGLRLRGTMKFAREKSRRQCFFSQGAVS